VPEAFVAFSITHATVEKRTEGGCFMAKRKSIHIKGMEHGAPIPNGAAIGNIIFSSAISGKDAETGVLSSDPDEQAEAMFRNLRLFMKAAGGSPADIGHMTVFLKDEKHRESVNRAWLKMFPDEPDRPARHALRAELRGEVLFQIEVIAVL
jgi:2-iminobutanoate/2-iminopropanoate deaminase